MRNSFFFTKRARTRATFGLWPVTTLVLLAACATEADLQDVPADDESSTSVSQANTVGGDPAAHERGCSFCTPLRGGETSDHDGGDELPCVFHTTRTLLAAGEEPSPFHLAQALERMRRGVDASARLSAIPSSSVQPLGYSEETRVLATLTPGDSTLVTLDLEKCPEGNCPQEPFVQVSCEFVDYIEIEFDVRLETADSAIRVTSADTARLYPPLMQGSLSEGGSGGQGGAIDEFGELSASVRFDLSASEGTLDFTEPEEPGPHSAILETLFDFGAETTDGFMSVEVVSDGPDRTTHWAMDGHWPRQADQAPLDPSELVETEALPPQP